MFKYAQLDDAGRCISLSYLSGEVEAANMLLLSETDDVQLGDVYDGTAWTRPVPPPPSLDEVKANKLAELEAARDNVIYSSFTSTALDGATPKTYNYDKKAADNFRAQGTLLSLDPTITSVDWYVIEDAAFTSHSRDQFIQVIKDGATHDKSQQMKYFVLEAQVKSAEDSATIESIIW
ncbi:hypothetical protein KZ483_24040 [Paenibacillus sp. sptzw28]|uniref:DUF4376 domain-containing protein n=1 Tax=Paenibacillus sp. sptzw28 TaxID=715179 RepID=UPI001C6F19EB|nr:hypothetical protein [Paenibacillus sp. sptzw28]QYR20794.1 hypothetical protein KZ483_24040 [Paenibacillus sp. sptzw28]